ncbi:transposase [Patescibacteria group bacterium]|nr:transposase [Patescibacteria group bacterium]
MAQRNIQFVNGEIYHIVMRAIDGSKLFQTKEDYLRMIHDLFEFNDINSASSKFRVAYCRGSNVTPPGGVTLENKIIAKIKNGKRKLLVEILAFCLMSNHIHLLLRQSVNNGISKFMQKFGGYSQYCNKKYGRKGHLFQDRFRAVHIEDDDQLITVFVYIHTNPVSLIYPKWKKEGIKNIKDLKQIINYIENYRWSSYPDYLENKNFPSITSRKFSLEIIKGVRGCRKFVNDWLKYKKELVNFNDVAIE